MTNPQRVRTSRGHTRCHSASLAKIVTGSISEAPRSNPANDLRHFAATMFASTGASTKQIMSRGVWKSVAMVVRYEHAARGATLSSRKPSTPTRMEETWSESTSNIREIAHVARTTAEADDEVTLTSPLTSENDLESSGGETRTLNLAGPPEEDSEQHQLE